MDKPKILTAKELRTIMPRLSGWKLADNKLSRTFEFQDFVQSLSFINDGRVTDRDVEVAKKISSVYRARS
jgi:4a-hydroxytetrahydrobiopterin dehydratase